MASAPPAKKENLLARLGVLDRFYNYLRAEINLRMLMGLALVLIMLRSVANGVGGSVQGLEWPTVLPAAVVGMTLGWWLARLALRPGRAALLGVLTGMLFVLIVVGNLYGQLLGLPRLLVDSLASGQIESEIPSFDPTAIILALDQLMASIGVLFSRILTWLEGLTRGAPGFDPVATALIWSLIVWLAAFWAGWSYRRWRRSLLAMLPAIGLVALTLALSRGPTIELRVVLTGTLLLAALASYEQTMDRWRLRRTDYAESVSRGMAGGALLVAFAVFMIATTAPSLTASNLAEFYRKLIGPTTAGSSDFVRSIGLDSPAGRNEEFLADYTRGGLPNRHLIGAGPELSEEIVMLVSVEDPFAEALPEPPSYYWRNLTYDRYTQRGWRTSRLTYNDFDAGDNLQEEQAPYQRTIQQDVRMVEQLGGLLHVSGDLVSADASYGVGWRSNDDMFGATTTSNNYQATSQLTTVDSDTLRDAGEQYPDWIRNRYLSLPDTIPNRVRALALDLTAIQPTPYDRALALESYLRTFPYTLDVSYPPTNRDIVDYFLFDLQKGYCDYYATSMVVLARAAGLPARMALGYIGGTYSIEEEAYLVSQAESHSWVEIYFPEIGWVSFEPTAGRSALERPSGQELIVPPELTQGPPVALRERLAPVFEVGQWILVAGLALTAAVGLGRVTVRSLQIRRLPTDARLTELYKGMGNQAPGLGVVTETGFTPAEFGKALEQRLAYLEHRLQVNARTRSWRSLHETIAPARQEVEKIIELIVHSQYNPHPLPPHADQESLALWRRLRWRLLLLRVWLLTIGRQEA